MASIHDITHYAYYYSESLNEIVKIESCFAKQYFEKNPLDYVKWYPCKNNFNNDSNAKFNHNSCKVAKIICEYSEADQKLFRINFDKKIKIEWGGSGFYQKLKKYPNFKWEKIKVRYISQSDLLCR